MKNTTKGKTAGTSEIPDAATGSGGMSRESISSNKDYPQNVEDVRQASTASNGAGKVTVGRVVNQGSTPGRKTGLVSEMAKEDFGLTKMMTTLKAHMLVQDGGLKLLFEKAGALETLAEKSRSPAVKEAIGEMLEAVCGLKENREKVVRSFNETEICLLTLEAKLKIKHTAAARVKEVDRTVVGTQTPCWWDYPVPTEGHTPEAEKLRALRSNLKPMDGELKGANGSTPQGEEGKEIKEANGKGAWTTVRKKRRKVGFADIQSGNVDEEPKAVGQAAMLNWTAPRKTNADPASLVRKRTPKSEAVIISDPKDGESYAGVMKRVMAEVNLNELEVDVIGSRRTKAGAILLEVKSKDEADRLADKLRQTIQENARVVRPTRRTPVLIVDVPEWMSPEEIRNDIITTDANLVGTNITIRENPGGGLVARLDVPMATASKMAERRIIKIGWARCRIKLLERKSPRCFRCQAPGHIAKSCTAEAVEVRCYRCRRPGHLAKDCNEVIQPQARTASRGKSVKLQEKDDLSSVDTSHNG